MRWSENLIVWTVNWRCDACKRARTCRGSLLLHHLCRVQVRCQSRARAWPLASIEWHFAKCFSLCFWMKAVYKYLISPVLLFAWYLKTGNLTVNVLILNNFFVRLSNIDLFWQPFCGKCVWNALSGTCLASGVRSQCSPSPLTDINVTEGLASIDLDVAVPAKMHVFKPHCICFYCSSAGHYPPSSRHFKFPWQCFIRQLAF